MRHVAAAALALLFLAVTTTLPARAQRSGKLKKDKGKAARGPAESPSQDSPGSKKSKIEYVGGKTLEEWKKDLTHTDPSRRTQAIIAVTGFGNTNAECTSLLIKRTYDFDVSPRVKAVMALRYVAIYDRDMPKVVAALTYRVRTDSQT